MSYLGHEMCLSKIVPRNKSSLAVNFVQDS